MASVSALTQSPSGDPVRSLSFLTSAVAGLNATLNERSENGKSYYLDSFESVCLRAIPYIYFNHKLI